MLDCAKLHNCGKLYYCAKLIPGRSHLRWRMPLCCQLPSRLAHLLDLQYCWSWQPLFLRLPKWLWWPMSLNIVDYNHIPESFASCWCNWRCSCFGNFTILCLWLQLTSMPGLQVGQYYLILLLCHCSF